MARIVALFSTCALLLVLASAEPLRHETKKLMQPTLTKPYVYRPENFVDINGTNYYFASEGVLSDWFSNEDFCRAAGMTMSGMETQEEWDNVVNYMNTNGLSYWYWTSGTWTVNTTWTWTDSGMTFDSSDSRWGIGEPGSRDRQGASIYVANRVMWGEDFTIANHAMCEGTPAFKLD
ncbi:hypothetical protein B566_EDAN010299 [Ephemera danica]|nr:hypothetical protein B566_EDAN010299 [Ephemera danica]